MGRHATHALTAWTLAVVAAALPAVAPAQPARSASAAATAKLEKLDPSSDALRELQPDALCREVVERFDVFEKAKEFAGEAAQLRLQQLLASDMKQSDLSESDKRLLRYLAYTTIWVPSSVETAVGKSWAALTSKGNETAEPSGRTQRAALQRQAERLEQMRAGVTGFPGDARLLLDPEMSDALLSRVGGLVVTSPTFLGLMDSSDGTRDALLLHELAHLYKRHTLKALQYELVLSVKGWNIARKLLRMQMPRQSGGLFGIGNMVDRVKSTVENMQTAKEVFDFVRDTQIRYGVDQEFEADACAVRWMPQFEIDPQAAWIAFSNALQSQPPGGAAGGDASYAALHPSPPERERNIAAARRTAPRTAAESAAARSPKPTPTPKAKSKPST